MPDADGTTVPAVAAPQPRVPIQFEASDFDQLYRMARALSESGLLPEALRGKPADIAIIMMQGRELGLQPMQSINGIDVIQGKPNVSPALMAAMVRASPACEYLTLVESGVNGSTWTTKRRGAPKPVTMSYTAEMAQRAGLAGKDNYRKNPEAMYLARGLGRICRAEYQDVIKGMYVKGEILDEWAPEAVGGGTESAPDTIEGEVIEQAPEPNPAEQLKRAVRRKKTESSGAPAPADTVTGSASPAPSAPQPEAPPAPVAGAPAAPSPSPEEEVPAWRASTELVVVFGDIVRRQILLPTTISDVLRAHGATRGHPDGCLGLRTTTAGQERLVAALKEACERALAEKARVS